MYAFEEFMRDVYKGLDEYNNLGPGDRLGKRILRVTDPKEIIEMQKEIDDFYNSDVPKKEKEILDSYLECYYMKLDAVLPGGILAAGIFELEEDEK